MAAATSRVVGVAEPATARRMRTRRARSVERSSRMPSTLDNVHPAFNYSDRAAIRPGSDRDPTGIRPESDRNPTGIRSGSGRDPVGIRPGSDRGSRDVPAGSGRHAPGGGPGRATARYASAPTPRPPAPLRSAHPFVPLTPKDTPMGSSKKGSAARTARIEEMRRAEQARTRRGRVLVVAASAVVVAGLVVGGVFVVRSQSDDGGGTAKADSKGSGRFVTGEDGVRTWEGTRGRNHVTEAVDYPVRPPVGGD